MQQTLDQIINKHSRFIDTQQSINIRDIEPELIVHFNKLGIDEKNIVIKKGLEYLEQADETLKNNLINDKVAKQYNMIENLKQTIKEKENDMKDMRKNLKEIKRVHINEIRDITNQLKGEIKDINTDHKQTIKDMKKDMNHTQKETIENIRDEMKTQYQTIFEDKRLEIENLKKEISIIEKEKNNIETQLMRANKQEINEIQEKFEKKIAYIEKNNQESDNKKIHLIEKLQDELNNKKQRDQNSCLKGIDGEKFTKTLTHKVFTPLRGDVTDVHGEKGKGDFIISIEKNMYLDRPHTIMIDSKNYTTPVPLREVKKIKKDLRENTNYDAAILLSQEDVKISQQVPFLDFEFIKDENDNVKPIMYITNVKEMPDLLLQSYMLLCVFLKNKEIVIKEEKMIRLKEKFNKISSLIAKETRDFNDYSKKKKEFIKELKQILNDVQIDFLSK